MQKIVVAFDGSDHSLRALDRAVEVAGEDAELVVVCAARLPKATQDPLLGVELGDPVLAEEVEGTLAAARERLAGKGRRARTVQGYGGAADAIVRRASEEGADLIVIGTRGLTGTQRALLGSVSTKVLHHAPCDVLVVR